VSTPEQKKPVVVVLIVEDEWLVRFDVAICLEDAGYIVLHAASGEEAIAVCDSEQSIDIVFTDINLGGRANGWDVAEYFRRKRPNVSVLYGSGNTIDGRRVPGSTSIPKPYQQADVLAACGRLWNL
jgi:two-component system, response regulator PdtaR